MRDCLVLVDKAVEPTPAKFHLWSQEMYVIAPSVMVGGHSGGQMSEVYGLVEFPDGTCHLVRPTQIRFIVGGKPDEITS